MNEGERIRLRSVREEDMKILFEWINDPEIIKYTHTYLPISEPEQKKWYQSLSEQSNNFLLNIELKTEKRIIGTCSLHDINWQSRRAELTIKICEKSERGKGYAKEALSCLIDFGFNDLNLKRIWLGVFPDNARAVKLYKNLGFKEEGLMRKHYFIQGEYKDVLIMGLLKE